MVGKTKVGVGAADSAPEYWGWSDSAPRTSKAHRLLDEPEDEYARAYREEDGDEDDDEGYYSLIGSWRE